MVSKEICQKCKLFSESLLDVKFKKRFLGYEISDKWMCFLTVMNKDSDIPDHCFYNLEQNNWWINDRRIYFKKRTGLL